MVRQVERCREWVPAWEPLPDEEDTLIRCGDIAHEQCDECTEWFCPEHLMICKNCLDHFAPKKSYCTNDLHTHSHAQMFMELEP